jgi:hypothetical protein
MFDEKNQNLVTVVFSCPENLNAIVLNLRTVEIWGGWVQGTNKKYRKVEWRATPGRKLHANLENSDKILNYILHHG